MKVLVKNRRASFDYAVNEKLLAGIVLTGPEVKSLRGGHASLAGSYVTVTGDEAFLLNAQINPYQPAGTNNVEPKRTRKLLLHRGELVRIAGHKQSGEAAVPLAIVLDHNLIKVEIGLGRGKKKYDKRETIKKRDTEREIHRKLKS